MSAEVPRFPHLKLILAVLLIGALFTPDVLGEEAYRWPLDQPRVLTSSFGEYRDGRFHMGIDLRTGPIGKPVYAAGDGHIERIRCSPYGYGKAVYLRLDDGHTLVYAHLDDYNDALRAHVRKEQHRRQQYSVDLYPEPGQFRVTRGDLIAKSGQTGIGAPHLHFEVRNGSGAPIDPRTIGFEWADSKQPVLRSAVVRPVDPRSTINGSFLPIVSNVRRVAAGRYVLPEISARGPLAFAVYATDSGGGTGTRTGIGGARVNANDAQRLALNFDALSYAEAADGIVAFDPYFRSDGKFLSLWRWPGNDVTPFARGEDGVIDLVDDTTVHLELSDAHGNRSTLEASIRMGDDSAVPYAGGEGRGTGKVRFEPAPAWVVCVASFSAQESDAPTLVVSGAESEDVPFVRTGPKEFQAVLVPAPGAEQLRVQIDHPRMDPVQRNFGVIRRGARQPIIASGGIRIQPGPRSAYGVLLVSVEGGRAPSTKSLRPAGDARYVWHASHPVGDPLRLTYTVEISADRAERVHLYRFNGSGWRRLDTERSSEGLTIETRRLGWFRPFEDLYAPQLRPTSPPDGYHAKTRRPIVKARLADVHSGVDTFGITANEEWLLAAYDPEHGEIRWERDEDLPSGETRFEIWARDHAGNEARKGVTVYIP